MCRVPANSGRPHGSPDTLNTCFGNESLAAAWTFVGCLLLVLLTTLCLQVFLACVASRMLVRIRQELLAMRADLQRERQTYLSTGVITSNAPRICASIMRDEGICWHPPPPTLPLYPPLCGCRDRDPARWGHELRDSPRPSPRCKAANSQ